MNRKDEFGNTALHLYFLSILKDKEKWKRDGIFMSLPKNYDYQYSKIIQVFIKHHFDFNSANNKGFRVVDFVSIFSFEVLIDVIQKNPTPIDLHKKSYKGNNLLQLM
jgi:hypothetical protein